jgi:glyoxylase-like metal-dependent hydrolase (beta-lactamase superfamily II)
MEPGIAAAYLLLPEEGRACAFVETNTAHAVPTLLKALEAHGRTPEDVQYVIITHIHLDHAGGAGQLMAACPNATLLAHPKAAPHAVDPSRIVRGATAVYGEERFASLYGEVRPIPEERVVAMDDDSTVQLGNHTLRFLHTRGHANHHMCVFDETANGVFTGDSFGILYPALQRNGLFAFPSTSPTDFDGPAAIEALDRIVGTGAARVWPTHFDVHTDLAGIADQLRPMLERSTALVDEADASGIEDEALDAWFDRAVRAMFEERLVAAGLADDPVVRRQVELDIDLNGQGLAFAVRKRRFKRAKSS